MEKLVVYQKTYDMIQYGYIALKQFPRSEGHTFVAEIKITMMNIMRLIIVTNKKYYKKTTMKELDTELETLRVYVRLAEDLNFLPIKKYEIWSKKLEEIGKLIGGWIKSIKS
jgi:hypothetical protein